MFAEFCTAIYLASLPTATLKQLDTARQAVAQRCDHLAGGQRRKYSRQREDEILSLRKLYTVTLTRMMAMGWR